MSSTPVFDPVPVRARRDGWTPDRQIAFIVALADTRCVAAASRIVGLSWQGAYALRARPDAASFAAAWDEALAAPIVACTSRILDGIATPIFYRGRQIGERRRYDNRQAMFILAIHGGAPGGQAVNAASALHEALTTLDADLTSGKAPAARHDAHADVSRGSATSAADLASERGEAGAKARRPLACPT